MVKETFFSIEVDDMERARRFYAEALGAMISFATPVWISVHIAGVRIGLFLNPEVSGKPSAGISRTEERG
jgi:extradiol dioxygenase family protein